MMSADGTINVEGFGVCGFDNARNTSPVLVLPAEGPWCKLPEYTEELLEEMGIDPWNEEQVKTLPYGELYLKVAWYNWKLVLQCTIVSGDKSYAVFVSSELCRSFAELKEAGRQLADMFFQKFWTPPALEPYKEGDVLVREVHATFCEESFQEKLADGVYDNSPEGTDVAPPTIPVFTAWTGREWKWFLSRFMAEEATETA